MKNENAIPTPESFGLSKGNTAYVRAVSAADLDSDIKTPEGVDTLYALHDSEGRRLALFDNRDFAFQVAKQNDLTAMSAH
jgi:hypothetical protein